MEAVTEDQEIDNFLSKFYNLEGVTLKEKQEAFNRLLLTVPPNVDNLFAALNPRCLLEQIFKVKILLKLQKIPMLIQILQQGDESLSFQIIKDRRFCQILAINLEEESLSGSFVDTVIPCLSYVLRLRLLEKLAFYGKNLNCLFQNVYNKYGAHIATKMLVGCSEKKIKEMLETTKVTLSVRHLKKLYDKSTSVFEVYLSQNNFEVDSILSHVAKKDINHFLELTKKYKILKIGKRTTRRLIKLAKTDIIKNASQYKFLHKKTLVKSLGVDFDKYYINCFPPKFESLNYHFVCDYQFKKTLGNQRYYTLMKQGIWELYNKRIYEAPFIITDEIMETLPEEEREIWITTKKENGTDDEDLLKYLPLKDSIFSIKQRINVTSSINYREKLLKTLLETCKFHNDLNALKEVLTYILQRHRNDEALADILYHLNDIYELEKLEASHWNSIKQISEIITARGRNVYYKENQSLKYIEFLFNAKLLTDEDILNHLKIIKGNRCWDKQPINHELKKKLIFKLIEFMPRLLDEEEELVFYDLSILNQIIIWNKENPKDKLYIFGNSRLQNSFEAALNLAIKDEGYEPKLMLISNIIEYYLKNEDFSDTMIQKYFSFGFRYYNLNIDLHLLKHRPEVILQFSDKFCEHLLGSYHPDLQVISYIKKYSFLFLPEKIISYCQKMLENSEHKSQKLFVVLASLLSAEEFLFTIRNFYPNNDMSENTKAQAIYVAESFKYTASAKVLSGLIKFCQGDFLRYSLESLYYLFYHLPEAYLSQFLDELSSKAVSVRKHSIFLACIIGSVDVVQKLLTTFNRTEKNVSVQKHLFTAALKYFVKNPSDSFWTTVKLCIGKLDQNDKESFDLLTNLSLIPIRYQIEHVTFVWTILQPKDKSKLLSKIPAALFEDLPLEFICEVISGQFFNENSTIKEYDINNFVINAIHKSKLFKDILNLVFTTLTRFRSDESLENQKKLAALHCSFISSFIDASAADDINQEVVKEFTLRWQTHFSSIQYFEEHIKLSLLLQFLNVGKDLEKFSMEIAEIFNCSLATYGIIIIDIFASVLQNCLTNFFNWYETSTEFFILCIHLMKKFPKLEIYFLIIKLLPDSEPTEDKAKEIFYNVLSNLQQITNESVQVLFNVYVNKSN